MRWLHTKQRTQCLFAGLGNYGVSCLIYWGCFLPILAVIPVTELTCDRANNHCLLVRSSAFVLHERQAFALSSLKGARVDLIWTDCEAAVVLLTTQKNPSLACYSTKLAEEKASQINDFVNNSSQKELHWYGDELKAGAAGLGFVWMLITMSLITSLGGQLVRNWLSRS